MSTATARRQSPTKIHEKIQELSWTPTFAKPADKYPTDYRFERAPKKDPMKQVLRSYFPKEGKDQRLCGAMDGVIRGNMFRHVQQRWMEWQKLILSFIPFAEILGGARDAACRQRGAEAGSPQRAGDPDDWTRYATRRSR